MFPSIKDQKKSHSSGLGKLLSSKHLDEESAPEQAFNIQLVKKGGNFSGIPFIPKQGGMQGSGREAIDFNCRLHLFFLCFP